MSTAEQSTARQTHLLAEAGLTDGADGVRVLSGPLSGIVDLAAGDATTIMLVNVLISVGQFQRDLQNELTRDGLAAARAAGAKSGRRPRLEQLGAVKEVRQAYRDGASIAALAREHDVSRVAIRTAVADLMPGHLEQPAIVAAVDEPQPVRIEIPGTIARHLTAYENLGEAEGHALRRGREIRRGQGFSLHVTALPHVHQALLTAAAELNTSGASPAERKAYRIYTTRLESVAVAAAPT
ncbi:hypothetical protein ABZ863_04095 [Saccharomonospora sp. NPDC046836]|uniref:hypothetical protein n=1 Tax=Saccharomonospora sp. NPDC046836 TaxID=3156921 RepID=UPI0033D787A1